jgi:hypothetical protein
MAFLTLVLILNKYTSGDLPHPRGEICVKRDKYPFMGYFNDPTKR